jgi:RNA polymerase sigma-70 factor (ECF subfamily)
MSARSSILTAKVPELAAMSDLESVLDRIVGEASRVDEAAFLAHLAELLPADGTAAEVLRIVRGDDLALALSCGRGDAEAIAEFERRYAREVPGALSRIEANAQLVDEVAQLVREKLFVGPPPKILSYSGRGPLVAWLRAVAVHTAVSIQRSTARAPRTAGDDALADLASSSSDPEIAHLRERFAEPFRTAFLDALAELVPQQRTVLRLNVIDGLNIEQIGEVYGVHRATVARWIASSRERLMTRTRELLCERLGLDASEVASIERLCLSQLDISLRSALADHG